MFRRLSNNFKIGLTPWRSRQTQYNRIAHAHAQEADECDETHRWFSASLNCGWERKYSPGDPLYIHYNIDSRRAKALRGAFSIS